MVKCLRTHDQHTSIWQNICVPNYLIQVFPARALVMLQQRYFWKLCTSSLGTTVWRRYLSVPTWLCYSICTKPAIYRHGLRGLVWRNLTGLHWALRSTLLNVFGMITGCKPCILTQSCKKPYQGSGGCQSSKKGVQLHIKFYGFQMECSTNLY